MQLEFSQEMIPPESLCREFWMWLKGTQRIAGLCTATCLLPRILVTTCGWCLSLTPRTCQISSSLNRGHDLTIDESRAVRSSRFTAWNCRQPHPWITTPHVERPKCRFALLRGPSNVCLLGGPTQLARVFSWASGVPMDRGSCPPWSDSVESRTLGPIGRRKVLMTHSMRQYVLYGALFLATTQAIAADPTWIADARGCKVSNLHPLPNEYVTWSGDCPGGYAEGGGTLSWFLRGKPGGVYRGELKGGTADGHGVYQYPSGARYEGGFVEGRYEGHGVYRYASGSTF